MNDASEALLTLGRALASEGYQFVSVTPSTHERVERNAARAGRGRAQTLRDVFGWNRPFDPDRFPPHVTECLRVAGACREQGELLRSTVRVSSLSDHLFIHSGFPTSEANAVFFGPDTYRFGAMLERWLPRCNRVVDVGCGTGVGGILAAPRAQEVVLADINERALQLAQVNARLAGVAAQCVHSDVLGQVTEAFDLVVSNPPYLRDEDARVYREGGGQYGEGLSVRIVRESLFRLRPRGTLLLYTGSAIVDGIDTFRTAVTPLLHESGATFRYEEIDPDVFGDELDGPLYRDVDRIAAVALRARLP